MNDLTKNAGSAGTVQEEAPNWDMSVVFPGLDSREFGDAKVHIEDSLIQLEDLTSKEKIEPGQPQSGDDKRKFEAFVHRWNEFEDSYQTYEAYIYSFVTTDAKNILAQSALSDSQSILTRRSKIYQRFSAWSGERNIAELTQASETAKELEHFLNIAAISAQKMMPMKLEDLASELRETGSEAWSRLHGDYTASMQVEVNGEQVPMPVLRGQAYDSDRTVRQTAYNAELAAWKDAEMVCAACMNSIKGEVNIISAERGWETPLEPAMLYASTDKHTLDAMMGAAKDAFPMMRRYFKAKAKLVSGDKQLPWFDLFAPVGVEKKAWTYSEGAQFVIDQFRSYSDKMGDFAQRAVDENWIDARAQSGKRDGAFCMGLRKDESRLLQTWKNSFGAVSTLAHELGHAYHNLCLAERNPLQKQTPMTLAETASIFCETVVSNAAMEAAAPEEQLAILEATLQRASQTVVDISSRFLFEQRVFEKRKDRSLTAEELCDAMAWAQEETYGDGLSSERHPYMWAVKPHYYSTYSYYNFPYMFGMLFSLGLYAIYQKDPESFKVNYDNLLSSTGMAPAYDLAKKFGIDIRSKNFWAGSLKIVEADVVRFEELVG